MNYLRAFFAVGLSFLSYHSFGQCPEPDRFVSILIGAYDCDSIQLTALYSGSGRYSWYRNNSLIDEANTAEYTYRGPVDGAIFKVIVEDGETCASAEERIMVAGPCPREDCTNGIDDDGDGLIDLLDVSDCNCEGVPEFLGADLVANGNFERRNTGGECEGCYDSYWQLDCVEDWEAANATTSIEHVLKCFANEVGTAFINYTLGNNASFIAGRVGYDNLGFSTQEAPRIKLLEPTVPGKAYRITLQADVAGGSIKNLPIESQRFVWYGSPVMDSFPYRFRGLDSVIIGGRWDNWIPIDTFTVQVNRQRQWQYFELEFVAPAAPLRYLVFAGIPETDYAFPPPRNEFTSSADYEAYWVLDNVKLKQILAPPVVPDELVATITSVPLATDSSFAACESGILLSTPFFPDYDYQWYHDGIGLPGADAATLAVPRGELDGSSYQVRVFKDGICRLSQPVRVEPARSFTVDLKVDSISCYGAADARIAATVNPVEEVLSATLWQAGNKMGEEIVSAAEIAFTGLGAGAYELELTDRDGCRYVYDFALAEPQPLILALEAEDVRCDSPDGRAALRVLFKGGRAPYRFALNGEELDTFPGPYRIDPGDYSPMLIDDSGCVEEAPNFTVEELAPFELKMTTNRSVLNLGQELRLSYLSNRTLVDAYFQWSEPIECENCPNPRLFPLRSDTFSLTVTDSDGCSRKDSLAVTVQRDYQIYYPNAISPNGDGINDFFTPYAGPAVEAILRLEIYDRWGALLYAGSQAPVWDGTGRNGEPVGPGTYIYRSRARFIDGREQDFAGSITVVR